MYKQQLQNYAKLLTDDFNLEDTTYSISTIDVSNQFNNYYVINVHILTEEPSPYDPQSTIIRTYHTQFIDEYNRPIPVDKADLQTLLQSFEENNAYISNKEELQALLN